LSIKPDSEFSIQILEKIIGDKGERIRWLFSLKAIDQLLDDFKFNLDQKTILLNRLQSNFGQEFNKNTIVKKQLSKKIRKERQAINNILNSNNDKYSEMYPLFELLQKRSQSIIPIAEDIILLKKSNQLKMSVSELISSYIHMMMNRIFISKQRLHEMVIYDFLYNYYKSAQAKIANAKS